MYTICINVKIPIINILPKIRMFLWRAVSGALAVADRLNSRGLGVDNVCKLCNGGPETINHVLFQCQDARSLWSEVGLSLASISLHQSLEENISYVLNLMEDNNRPQPLVCSVPWVLWLIWKNRNSILYAETQLSSQKLIGDMKEEVELWFQLTKNMVSESTHMQNGEGWSPPDNGTIKCNIHANWRNAHLIGGLQEITPVM